MGELIGVLSIGVTIIFGVLAAKNVIKSKQKGKNNQSVSITGNNTAPIVNGDGNVVKTGVDFRAQESEPTDQDEGGLWFKVEKD